MATRVALMYPECGEQNEYRMHSACRFELSASHSTHVERHLQGVRPHRTVQMCHWSELCSSHHRLVTMYPTG